ncbi:hypothetical protein C1645_741518 [Glomus cerebriforme]|uniref:Uncharacterized protein n=1 Tax=Glomus cerebriforme TaxID=658196 RepID=A0A397SNH7_9GLOM|nr:hypothetical protein C1645_741518 [Glomus cerebriforme]
MDDVASDQIFEEKYGELTQEKYEKIIALQQKHDAEIHLLAKECQLELSFVKNIFKDNREPAPRKSRNISPWNAFQSEWFKKNNIKATAPGAQKKCAEEYTSLDEAQLNSLKRTAEEISKNRNSKELKLVENINLRKTELNNQICTFRKLYRTLQITCGVEFLTIIVPLNKELNSSYFGTPVGEEFYKTCLKIDEIVNNFYHFSCLKKAARNEIIKQVGEISFQQDREVVHDTTGITSNRLSITEINNPNSKNTRNKVRKILQEKFRWPENVLFCNYSDLNIENKQKVLNNLDNIHFEMNNLE